MRDVVICHAVRTPVGRFGGVFREVSVQELAATAIRAVIDRSGIDSASVDDVILGQGYPNGEAPALGRVAALDAGLSVTVPGLQVDRRCGSGLQAVGDAAMRVASGQAEIIIAGGAESMSRVEFSNAAVRWGVRAGSVELADRLDRSRMTAGGKNHPIPGGMIETAENLRRDFSISRATQDLLAAASHARAVAAQREGRFDEEIAPVTVLARRGESSVVREDEQPRVHTDLEELARLRPIMQQQDPEATVTAGNASGQCDGAAACLVMPIATAERIGLEPLAWFRGWSVTGLAPEAMGLGPVAATERVLERVGLQLADLDLIELNEAFAAQVLAVTNVWELDPLTDERINPNGSGISLGHPIGATGARILATMLHELRRTEGRFALETMCIGGGQGMDAVFERFV